MTGISVAAENDEAVQALARKSGGSWSVELRNGFLDQARKEVLQQAKVSEETIAWVDSRLDARQAVYGSVYPADARILENLDQLRKELGPELFDKYHQFCLGAAVARRKIGVGPVANARSNLKFGTLFAWADEAEQAGNSPSEALTNREASGPLAEGSPEKQAYDAVKAYLAETSLTPKNAYQSDQHKTALEGLLAKAGVKKPDRALPGILQQWMREKETRPVARSIHPRVSDYLKFLDKIYTIPKSELSLQASQKWPLFPLRESPWPILMPLSMTWPLDEAQYILGEVSGPARRKTLSSGCVGNALRFEVVVQNSGQDVSRPELRWRSFRQDLIHGFQVVDVRVPADHIGDQISRKGAGHRFICHLQSGAQQVLRFGVGRSSGSPKGIAVVYGEGCNYFFPFFLASSAARIFASRAMPRLVISSE